MPTFSYASNLPVSPADACAWHARPGALERLLPPWQDVRVLSRTGDLTNGGTVTLSVPLFGPLRKKWVARHDRYEPGVVFRDVQERGPFARWRHEHRFRPTAAGCELNDHIDYQLPLGDVGELLGDRFVRRDLHRMFAFRHRRTCNDLERIAHYSALPPLRIALGGGSGLVGTQLSAFLRTAGHTVVPLRRGAAQTIAATAAPESIAWNPERDELDADALATCDAVIHLGGAGIADRRWSAERKRLLRDSRVRSTKLLADTIAKNIGKNSAKMPVLIVASAIGWYGDGVTAVDEQVPRGNGFLPELCRDWEAAADPARVAGARVVHARFGVVLSARGGALKKMLPAFQCGVGGPIGSGAQMLSWIALDDVIYALHHLLHDERARGPVNLVAPRPVPQREFARALGRTLHRPAFMPLPTTAVKLLFGEMGATVLLGGQRVVPRVLGELGYAFEHADIDSALAWELGKVRSPQ